ncbi:MAG: DUF502 domain-containing protein [Candidatus Brocadia sp. AMX2]|uniref:Transporter n=1 Tax=Candidatus Brocadia sinica JPN1 TaxID=1197129 RepID=A0ABQ0K384_9BACT|nr:MULTISPECIES: DUF502 domain-containing protein [Brocadia]KXK27997.1 MAG: hypothetical protein UZ01_02852 [Candidatus Brocadia sinica]MBC6933777.1 DUF502 domain-containing protein [Candidatus Brocadia sp.]MBL1170108.1 DUF502 domain-containing protein [Candidatus Brocadia sp. AMX1]NOG43086.1 DUF502 domain-containing protein [Planctomycetota bacterium]KAA0242947.1 MAG: DUF502 domain-containing protein [Candidatus Brocadia sp. AMX2]
MEETKHGVFTQFKKDVRKRMLTGLLLILPVYVTFFVVKFLFSFVGGTLAPVIKKFLQFLGVALPKTSLDEFIITFLGLILTFIALYFIGIFAANFVGKAIINYFENLLTKTPVIRNIYSSVKQIIHAVSLPGKQSFKRVVFVDFPKEGTKSIGFVTGTTQYNNEHKFISVFIPTTPNPTTGFLIFTKEDDVIDTNLTVEEAFKTLLSGGVLTPKDIESPFKTAGTENFELK